MPSTAIRYSGKAPQPITKWGQLGLTGEWAARDIHPVGVNFPDGISNFIRLRVCKGGDLRQGIREEHTGGPINVLDRIVTDVTADPCLYWIRRLRQPQTWI